MEVLDTTVANVSLHTSPGDCRPPCSDSEWVITSYLAANAIVVPISGWLAVHLGRRNYFLLSIAVFSIASGLCGMATSLWQIILFRALQGLAGGGLQPSSQGILLDSFPPEKQGAAMTLFGVAALLRPSSVRRSAAGSRSNTNGDGSFTSTFPSDCWPWWLVTLWWKIPIISRPKGRRLARQKFRFDTIGLSLLVIAMASWEVVLSKGQEWDWFGDPFWRVQTLALLFVFGLGGLIVWEMRQKKPDHQLPPAPGAEFRRLVPASFSPPMRSCWARARRCRTCCNRFSVMMRLASGLVLSPSGISAVMGLPIVGFLLGRQLDARWLIAAGLFVVAVANFWMSRMNLLSVPGKWYGRGS